MSLSRVLTVISLGIFIPSFFGLGLYYFSFVNNILVAGICLLLTYGLIGYLSLWASKKYVYIVASLSAIIVCVYQYMFYVFAASGDIIYTPDIFAISLFFSITVSNLAAWLRVNHHKKQDQEYITE